MTDTPSPDRDAPDRRARSPQAGCEPGSSERGSSELWPAARDGELRVRARGLCKSYRLYSRPWHRLIEALGAGVHHREHRALHGLDFDLRQGETLGVVGQNGAGKSTLLKMLAGVLQPSAGTLEVHGTISSILELGAGFHPDFTGHQNIRINAAMMGVGERQLEGCLPDIVDFCELGSFLDQPVKVYSSGMSMRLAFAIATQVSPDILIIDEALSVGDGYFQKKCMDRILELIEDGTSLLFCSHAMYYVSTLCQRVLWLRDGEVAAYGETDEVVQRYEEFLLAQQAEADPQDGGDAAHLVGERGAVDGARITAVDLSCNGRELSSEEGLRVGDTLSVDVSWTTEDPDQEFQVGIGIDRMDGVQIFGLDSRQRDLGLSGSKSYSVRFEVESQPLLRGQFTVHAFVLDEGALHVFDHRVIHDAFRIAAPPVYEFGMLRLPGRVRKLEPGD